MDPQRLGTPTAAYHLHIQKQLQQKHDLLNRGCLTVAHLGKREQLPASNKASQTSPRYAEVVVQQLDPRWARKGVTITPVKAAGYSTDVAVQTEFVGDLPACWSNPLGRSNVTGAKVAAAGLSSSDGRSDAEACGTHSPRGDQSNPSQSLGGLANPKGASYTGRRRR
ncbi:TPA: hypothetical protein ACH3X2_001058 [Trebouxia sp. C0005]